MDAVAKKFLLMDGLSKALDGVDNRVQGRVVHRAHTIFLVVLAGVFAKCQTWNEIAAYGETKIDFLRRFIPDLQATPSHDTLRRFFSIISPDKPRHIAIDGKRMRSATRTNMNLLNVMVRDVSEYDSELQIHVVSAYDTTNEITADKTLLDSLGLHEGDLVTLDAMGTQKEIVELIRKKGADYLLIVKGNQKTLQDTIAEAVEFNMAKKRPSRNDEAEIVDEKGHGYKVTRYCFSVQEKYMPGSLYRDWKDVKTFGMFSNTRTNKNTGEESTDVQYFITSLDKDAARLINYRRKHWAVENGLHRTLDVEFNEDNSQKKENSAKNYSVITKMVMAVLKANPKKMPMSQKRLLARWNDQYMEKLILQTIQSFADF